MNIGLDGAYALCTSGKADAVEKCKYASEIIEKLATDYPQSRLLVYTPKLSHKTRLSLIDELHNVEYRLPAPSGFKGRLWRMYGITNCLQADKIEIYHGLYGELPLNIPYAWVPSVLTINESTLSDLKGEGVWPIRNLRKYIAMETVKTATLLIAHSDVHKAAVCELVGLPSKRVEVILPEQFSAQRLMEVYERAIREEKG